MGDVFETCFKMDAWHDFKVLGLHGLSWTAVSYLTRPKEYNLTTKKKKQVRSYSLTLGEWILFSILAACLLTNIYIRVAKGVPHWLWQPCHVLSAVLMYVMLFSGRDPRYFYSYFYSMWMPLVGFVSPPNETWFLWWWEIYVFYVHHAILLVIPYYYLLYNHRFHQHLNSGKIHKREKSANYTRDSSKSSLTTDGGSAINKLSIIIPHFTSKLERFKIFTHTFSHGIIYHAFFLGQMGILLDEDFDAMRCRFAGGEIFGIYWREALVAITYLASLLVSWLPDYLVHRHYRNKYTKLPITDDVKDVKIKHQ
ncbi:hypothetical protein DFA_01782 [Cavenderia fasciculata]|uniref:Transmembrane protein n=1 Tax=Cavenderia fasciculata TaxID=261658 RepID=F4PUN2_CACFS|nr:uncharacterized protein DFA_01782 [Cavenderia fasciculata]EGG21896.1 hypothetical protein DFA_01782 [Cavenderia fasciculata]|eukprot:XP_004359747.1 hypothetical protein DFA_01782 [Cavenderia fasciculata]